MILLVSDLHLVSESERPTINVSSLLRRLNDIAKKANDDRVEELILVLLGDIFEILKSKIWIDDGVRPWENNSPSHRRTVESIFDSIVKANQQFFEGLNSLVKTYSFIRLEYVPGNHDFPLNTEMGAEARTKLQDILPLQRSKGELFNMEYSDKEHKLISMHGHQWDPANRYGSGMAAIGDAIVIDLVLSLPVTVSERLGVPYGDPSLEFLYELDNVRPHEPKVIAHWVTNGLAKIKTVHPNAYKVIDQTFQDLNERLETLSRTVSFGTFSTGTRRLRALHKLVTLAIKRLGALRVMRSVPAAKEDSGPYHDFALGDIQSMATFGGDYRYVVCGHTHDPMIVPLNSVVETGKPVPLYLNTGTWRRVRRDASGSLVRGSAAFGCWDEECAITIYSSKEQKAGHPEYEIYRVTRGTYG